jgi:hypothetical protein
MRCDAAMRIHTVIVTGALGAGKSSCVNALLAALPKGAVAAVCVHAFALSFGLETTEQLHRDRIAFHDEVFGASSAATARAWRQSAPLTQLRMYRCHKISGLAAGAAARAATSRACSVACGRSTAARRRRAQSASRTCWLRRRGPPSR